MQMNQLKIVEKTRIDGEKEGLEILNNIKSSLNKKEQILYFFFFVKNSTIFHEPQAEYFLKSLFLKNKIDFEEIVDLDIKDIDLELVETKILETWQKYIKNNLGTCSSYFGVISRELIKSFLKEKKYKKIKREAKICNQHNKPIHEDHIDIVGKLDVICDLYESKHAIYPQRKKAADQLKKLSKIVEELINLQFTSKRFLATIEFINKNVACEYVNINTLEFLNGEDVFKTKMKS